MNDPYKVKALIIELFKHGPNFVENYVFLVWRLHLIEMVTIIW